MFKCPRCGNTDPRYIGYLNGQPYCRRCITFSGKEAPQPRPSDKKITLKISYRLSKEQDALARKVLKNFLSGKDSLIHAVTGAGKTELVYYTMAYAISHRMSVGFSAPRRDVIIDLYPRLASAFPEARTIYVIGKHSSVLTGDIILLTNHQLYRYRDYFDLLIMDEIDAFPFKGDPVLNRFAAEAVRGNRILLSATPSKAEVEAMAKHGEVFSMLARYHRHPLPVPKFLRADFSPVLTAVKELQRLLKKGKQVFFFVPTIGLGQRIFPWLGRLIKGGALVDSEEEKRDQRIKDFKEGRLRYLVTTSILERGVTVRGLQVIVCQADHRLYTKEALIQIAGRAGRKKEEPDGEVIFVGKEENDAIREAIEEITAVNEKARVQNLLQGS
jgi:competence protein ComFA